MKKLTEYSKIKYKNTAVELYQFGPTLDVRRTANRIKELIKNNVSDRNENIMIKYSIDQSYFYS
jgi:hypothetical protein